MKQSKLNSFIEAVVNTAIGFIITCIFSPLIYSVCNVKMTYHQMGYATLLFTILSVIRSYMIRRLFNGGKIFQIKKTEYLCEKDQNVKSSVT